MELRERIKKVKPPAVKGLWKNLAIFFAVLGPGIITSNVDNDAGGIATYSIAGAHYGYGFVWAVLPVILSLIVIQEMSARMGAVTGKGLADLIREHFGLKITFYVMLALLVTNLANTMAEFAGVAASLDIFGVSKYISVPSSAFFIWWLVVKGSYRSVEKVFLGACLFYITYAISGVMANPDWGEVAHAAVHPQIEMNWPYLYMLIGVIGTTIAPWQQFYLQASIVEKGIDVENYRQSRWDVWIGCIMAGVVVFFIIISCAATLYPAGIQIENGAEAALALKPLAGKYASWLFSFGLFNASLFAASVLPLATAYYVCEGLGFEAGVNKSFSEAPQFYGLYTAIIIVSAAVVLVPKFPLVFIMVFSQVLNGILLPFVLIFMLILINKKKLMGEFANGILGNIISWTTALGLILLTLLMFFFFF
ncbi:MAG: Mn transporter [Deltaproteobacteria bacterium CG11_big_fil_rev_8_21_14_0_20_42_23]|nr:MAG: Mn transporter [Deltaproteobacteria bacterium CG11_big_fil_rev_8_21_14_0_20_42_23]PJC63596.1 MAG: Mn transporter [Deltaproteobacteria bacterium CG_4_9_14_0_2_um_filter_42_21]